MNCRPMGKPELFRPQGTEIAGWPVVLRGLVLRDTRPDPGPRNPVRLTEVLDVLGVDSWGAEWRGRRDYEVHALQYPGIIFLDQPLRFHGLGVVVSEDELPAEGAIQNVRPVVLAVRPQELLVGHDGIRHRCHPNRADVFHHRQVDWH